MKKFFYIIALLLLVSCNNNNPSRDYSYSNDNTESEQSSYTQPPKPDYSQMYDEGYASGYQQGYEDGRIAYSYSHSYNDYSNYSGEAQSRYESGYKNGYDEGYNIGKAEFDDGAEERLAYAKQKVESILLQQQQEYIEQQKEQDYHNWENDEIKAFYIELEGCESEEQAEEISYNYLGDYIEEWGRFFTRITVKNGTFEAEVGEKVTGKLFKIKGTDVYMLFRYLPNVDKWDEGVLEVWGNKGTFYKKPN